MLPTIVTSRPLPIDNDQLFHGRLFGRMATSARRGCDGGRRIALETALPERAQAEIRDVLPLKVGGLQPESVARGYSRFASNSGRTHGDVAKGRRHCRVPPLRTCERIQYR
jgi:hypothetical protein